MRFNRHQNINPNFIEGSKRWILALCSIFIAITLILCLQSVVEAQVYQVESDYPNASIDIDIPILGYHNIDPSAPNKYYVTPEQFALQMDILRAYGYQTISLDDYMDYQNGIGTPPEKPIILTFDDGYEGIYTYARPILTERDMQAAFFIPTAYIALSESERISNTWNSGQPLAYHMIWPEVIDLYNEGFGIESHSVTHANLTTLDPLGQQYEINQSKATIQSHIPADPVHFFAYPYGLGVEDPTIHGYLEQAQYLGALAYGPAYDLIANPATSDKWALPRRYIYRDMSTALDLQNPWAFFMRRIDPGFPIPNIYIRNFKAYDSDGNQRSDFYLGENISSIISIRNDYSPVNATASLVLQNEDEILYSSHTTNPVEDLALYPLLTGTTNLDFGHSKTYTESLGVISYSLDVYDEYYLLNYFSSSLLEAFTLHPMPISINANMNQVELKAGEPEQIVFTAKSYTSTTQAYLSVSISSGISIIDISPADGWQYYPIGSVVKVNGCSSNCPLTTFELYELSNPDFGIGEKTYTFTVMSSAVTGNPEWIKYRLALHLTEGNYTPSWYLRDPLSGIRDQQNYFSKQIDIIIKPKDIYLPIIFSN
jgi:peptidoglycan/xylan/chitin deacetylase (PgdA/CDA1 family)